MIGVLIVLMYPWDGKKWGQLWLRSGEVEVWNILELESPGYKELDKHRTLGIFVRETLEMLEKVTKVGFEKLHRRTLIWGRKKNKRDEKRERMIWTDKGENKRRDVKKRWETKDGARIRRRSKERYRKKGKKKGGLLGRS